MHIDNPQCNRCGVRLEYGDSPRDIMYKKILLKTHFVQHTSIQDVSNETNEHIS